MLHLGGTILHNIVNFSFKFSYTFHIIIGLYSVTGPVYVSEMSPSNIRGKLGLASYLHTGGGILIGSIAVGLFSIDSKQAYTIGWRLV